MHVQGEGPNWGRRALDFVDAIESAKTSAGVISQFGKMIGDLGFHAYIMAGIPSPGQSLAQLTVACAAALLQHPESVRVEGSAL